ncbi:MAG: hypothetical protein Q7T86_16230 [Hyphomicrobiaceae bacterium]|nr:hypothetical protein [Hyphomicrobiaceae bacterium]
MACAFRWIVLFAGLIVPTAAATATDKPRALACDIGPVKRTFGNTEWLVLSCSDRRTVIIYSMPDNPASPYYFMAFPQGRDGVRLQGQGIGDKKGSRPALKELRALSAKDISALVKETRGVARQSRSMP